MALKDVVVVAIAALFLLTFAAGCTLLSGEGGPPGTTATPRTTGAGGAAEETPSPAPTAVRPVPTATTSATPANPTVTSTATSPPTPTATAPPTLPSTPDETAGAGETTVAATVEPTPVPTGTATIAELAATDPELSRFVQALRQGGTYETLNGTGTYTVFAPNDEAFDAVPPGTLSRLLFDPDALAAVANYHVVYGRWLSSDLARESPVATRSGVALAVTVLPDGTLQVDSARVIRADIVATNGVLHVIDRVMIPTGAL